MRRTSLWQRGGAITTSGDPQKSELLATAWRSTNKKFDPLTHNLHAYPARLQPLFARTILAELRPRSVLDPFCGSGTLAVEASLLPTTFVGVDLNPFAVGLSELKTQALSQSTLQQFDTVAESIAETSFGYVASRHKAIAPIPKSEATFYSGHTLRELAGIWEEIQKVEDDHLLNMLELLFSSILVKCSKQAGHTSSVTTKKRLRKGLPTEFFLRKAKEWGRSFHAYARTRHKEAETLVRIGDSVRDEALSPHPADLIFTSPPYGGVYDYAFHHERSRAWLKWDHNEIVNHEIGSKRKPDAFSAELVRVLRSISHALAPSGQLVLVLGDAIEHQARETYQLVERCAANSNLQVEAIASQERPKILGKERFEHAFWVGRA